MTQQIPHESTMTETRVEEELSHGDAERFSHYVRKEKILHSQVTGKAVIALCGKVWIPVRNPDKYPVCPACKEIYAHMQGGGSDNAN